MSRLEDLKQILSSSNSKLEDEKNSLLISIDFGATYSGIAYLFTSSPSTIHQITTWPGLSSTYPKVPSILKYSDTDNNIQWGHEVAPTDPRRIEGFRQLLAPGLPKPLHIRYPQIQSELRARNKDALQATEDFLRKLYEHAILTIEKRHGDEYVGVGEVKFVLNFSGAWDQTAKRAVLNVAERVGISPVVEVGDAEAAAAYALNAVIKGQRKVQVDDGFILCDAGGGTVNVTSYRLKKMSPFKIEALAPIKSGLGGSMMLNKAFDNHLGGVIDDEEAMKLRKASAYAACMREFNDKIKPNFSFSKPESCRVTFPGARLTPNRNVRLEASALTLTSDELQRFFQSVSSEIVDFIKAQVRSVGFKSNAPAIKSVVLVGGLGSSQYLREHLTKEFPRLQILQPEHAWTAVNRGALILHIPLSTKKKNSSSKPRKPASRKSTHSYGIQSSPVFNPSLHAGRSKYWDSWEGVWRCTDTTWFIEQGESLSQARKIPLSFHKECVPYPSENEACVRVEVMKSGVFEGGPTQLCCVVQVPLSSIPVQEFVKRVRKSDRKEYWDLEYQFVIGVQDGAIRAWIEVDGVRYGEILIPQ